MKKLVYIAILGLIAVCFSGCWGWGWLVPYSFQPSYWEFKKMCKLNELPNDEEKYNKILAYFDLSLDSLDYDKFQETTTLNFYQQKPPFKKTKTGNDRYFFFSLAALYEYDTSISSRISLIVGIVFNNDKPQNKQDIESISINPEWQTYRINGIYWDIATTGKFGMPTKILDCDDLRRSNAK